MFDIAAHLKQKLQEPLPGMDAQYEMAPATRERYPIERLKPDTYRKSAVMILIYSLNNNYYIPLTKRHTYDGKHSGQISLPGGKIDESDINLQHTALRELSEEIGINDHVDVIGTLTPIYIPVSNFYVEPYIGIYSHSEINFSTNEREVNELIHLDLEVLKSDKIIQTEVIVHGDGYKLKTPYFEVEGNIIWGATAMILNEFKKLII
ncbi:MAG: NUDIX hydrolase [Sphingobacteriaceae bacterium]|jgi:8-oxo-dGTP pyrophosphatase MutT (NUDIX family)